LDLVPLITGRIVAIDHVPERNLLKDAYPLATKIERLDLTTDATARGQFEPGTLTFTRA